MTIDMQQFTRLTNEQFVNHIYLTYHQVERERLVELDVLVNRVLLAHYIHDKEVVLLLHRNVSMLKLLLQAHFAKKEKELYKAIRKSDKEESLASIRKSVEEVVAERKEIIDLLTHTKEVTNNFTPPEFACGTMQAVYTRLGELAEQVQLYSQIESEYLYSRFTS